MTQSWYYAKNNQRLGPVPLAELRALIAKGGLQPSDLVWSEHLPGWVPARKVRELFPQQTSDSVPGVRVPPQRASSPKQRPPQPEDPANRQAGQDRPLASRDTAGGPGFDWDDLRPRHWIAGGGAFLASLGIAFTAIARSPVSLAFTLGGLTLAALGLYAEIGRLLGQALENIAEASRAAAERRHEAKKLAVEKQRLDLEAKRLAHEQAQLEQAGRHQTLAPQSPAAAEDDHDHDAPGPQAAPGRTIVINHPSIQRWSPGLAAVLSFFLPGLGQLYKGQILNGIVWFFMVGLGYMALILPGLLLHLFCIIGAASGNPWTEGNTTVVRE